jgi:nicotinate-nucleotide adenylyltransferase
MDTMLKGAKRIGLMGGSFDPPHLGHHVLAQDALEALLLDEVWWIPSWHAPLKDHAPVAAYHRLAMIGLVVEQEQGHRLCTVEVDQGRSLYSVETARMLVDNHPDIDFFWLLGADQVSQLHRWKDPVQLASLVTLAVWSRPGFSMELDPSIRGISLQTMPHRQLDISSSEIRSRISKGLPAHMFLHPAVNTYIHAHNLFR